MHITNKNKNAKNLTLQEIVQKSVFRKTIQNICIIDNKVNQDFIGVSQKPSFLFKSSIESFKTTSQFTKQDRNSTELSKNETSTAKRSYQSTKQGLRQLDKIPSKSQISARQKSKKQSLKKLLLKEQDQLNHFFTKRQNQTTNKIFVKTTQNNVKFVVKSLDKINKTKTFKGKPHYLCVTGQNHNILPTKPQSADNARNSIPQYKIKSYQTIELGNQILGFNNIQSIKTYQESSHFKSLMTTKNSSSSFWQKQQNKMQSKTSRSKLQTNLKNQQKVNIQQRIINKQLYPNKLKSTNEIIKRKIQYRGIKTEQLQNMMTENDIQNQQNVIENAENGIQNSQKLIVVKKKLKNYQLKLNIQRQQKGSKKQTKQLNKINLKKQVSGHQISINQFLNNQNQLGNYNIEEKFVQKIIQCEQTKTLTKGFKGGKVRNDNQYLKTKTKFYIPQFIKSSLDPILINKKSGDQRKNSGQIKYSNQLQQCQQQNQRTNQKATDYLETNNNVFIEGQKCILKQKCLISQQTANEVKDQKQKMQKQEFQANNKINKYKKKKQPLQVELCGWTQNQKLQSRVFYSDIYMDK